MKLQLFIALRYLFSRKDHNAINIISAICAGGICVATMALVCVLSGYNGFQELIQGLFNAFDPDVKITLVEGKSFSLSDERVQRVKALDFVEVACDVMEENALIRNEERQTMVTVKGVSDSYVRLTNVNDVMQVGQFVLREGDDYALVVGGALANQIDVSLGFSRPLSLFVPKHDVKINLANPERAFEAQQLFVVGIYATNQLEIDSKYAFVDISLARRLLGYAEDEVTSLELRLSPNVDVEDALKKITEVMGPSFRVQDKQRQHADFYRMMKVEKWISFLILVFILLVAVFNLVGSLSMLILEKKSDIETLRNMGASNGFVRQVFLLEGWLISVFGSIVGVSIGLILCGLQKWLGIIKLTSGDEGGFVVDAYPICVNWSDVLIVLLSSLLIGLLISWFPTKYLGRETSQP
jgi:ABC-type transport system, involved in lipoprotein release, permease component